MVGIEFLRQQSPRRGPGRPRAPAAQYPAQPPCPALAAAVQQLQLPAQPPCQEVVAAVQQLLHVVLSRCW